MAPSPLPPSPSRVRRWELLVLLAVLCCGAFLRFYRISSKSFWIDECYTVASISGTGLRTVNALPHGVILDPPPILAGPAAGSTLSTLRPDREDIHPPLFFFIERIWANVFGWSETALRAFPALCSVAGIVFLFLTVRELTGSTAALWASALMAVAQPQIEMSQEARGYTLLLTLAAAACFVAVRIMNRGGTRRRAMMLGGICLVMPLVHYFGVFAVAALGLYAATGLRAPGRRAVLTVTVSAALLFTIGWLPVLYLQAHGSSSGGTSFFVDDMEGSHLLHTLRRLAILPARYLNDPLPNAEPLTMALWVAVLSPLVLRRRRPDLWLWGLWIPVQIAPSLAVDLLRNSWSLAHLRYTLLGSIAIYALLPGLVARSKPWLRHGLPTAAFFGCLLALYYYYTAPPRQDLRRLAEGARQITPRGDLTVVFVPDHSGMERTYLFALGYYERPLAGPLLILTDPPTAALLGALRQRATFTLITPSLDPIQLAPTAHASGAAIAVPQLGTAQRVAIGN